LRRLLVYLGAILATALALLYLANRQFTEQYDIARQDYIADARSAARTNMQHVDAGIKSIYENLRTLSLLPNTQQIDRHGENLSGEARITFQQIYNNLANNVSVSEVYILPIDFAPDRTDPVTGKPEEPILMFDELIVNAGAARPRVEPLSSSAELELGKTIGPPEIETYEYRQLAEHAQWFKRHFPTSETIRGLNTPYISGPEVITCDNTTFIHSGKDADRSGVMFSVPFFGQDGRIRGMISAIVLTSALRGLTPDTSFALVNPGYGYAALTKRAEAMESSLGFIREAKPDASLIYSEVLPLLQQDSRSPWHIWSGLPNEAFLSNPATLAAYHARTYNSIAIVLGALGAATCISLILKNLNQARALNDSLAAARDAAVQNMHLTHQTDLLRAVQNELVHEAKAEQLRKVVATIAHELRNPLSVIRTTAFTLSRKFKTSDIAVKAQISRIDSNVARCDDVITQFLEFSGSGSFISTETDIDDWLEAILTEAAPKLPDFVSIACDLGLQGQRMSVDMRKLARAINNILVNAVESVTPKGQRLAEYSDRPLKLEVSSRLTSRGVEISIADNGPGITQDILEKIREPLFTTKGFGAGLGLPDTENIARLHKGGLDINSEPLKGACFTIWLPISKSAQLAA
jgi:signal transduction histidine kinase